MADKFNEHAILEEVDNYIADTYGLHYGKGKYQATDMIIDAGHGEGFCIGNIMKYAMRCGKKDDKEKELFKIIHYAIIAIYIERLNDERNSVSKQKEL
jgi:hypothetical protein|tara:strand:- start:158 stop:451 length:294 start_codon:yes stop_codon:yes gene_type:complete